MLGMLMLMNTPIEDLEFNVRLKAQTRRCICMNNLVGGIMWLTSDECLRFTRKLNIINFLSNVYKIIEIIITNKTKQHV
jgi:hypothetical protein